MDSISSTVIFETGYDAVIVIGDVTFLGSGLRVDAGTGIWTVYAVVGVASGPGDHSSVEGVAGTLSVLLPLPSPRGTTIEGGLIFRIDLD